MGIEDSGDGMQIAVFIHPPSNLKNFGLDDAIRT